MERFGDYLKRKREEKNITVEGIARITKIQPYILRAIENNDIENLPHQTFVKGFIKNYCRALKIPWDKALSLFDEEQEIKVRDDSQKEIEILQKRKETSMIHRGLSFSPLVIAMIVLFVFILLFFTIKIAGGSRNRPLRTTYKNTQQLNYGAKGFFSKIYRPDASKK